MSTREARAEKRMMAFRQCPGCNYDFVTGEGTKSCGWFECPYLPEDLKVFCPACNYNFATGEGREHCADPETCQWRTAGLQHAANAHRIFGR